MKVKLRTLSTMLEAVITIPLNGFLEDLRMSETSKSSGVLSHDGCSFSGAVFWAPMGRSFTPGTFKECQEICWAIGDEYIIPWRIHGPCAFWRQLAHFRSGASILGLSAVRAALGPANTR